MEEPKNTVQAPLPSLAAKPQGNVVRLPSKPDNTAPADTSNQNRKPQQQSLWYALYFPQLNHLAEPKQQKYLAQLASLATKVSSNISFHPLSLVLEIRSSLKYFGGVNSVHNELKPLVAKQLSTWQLPDDFLYAASPTVTGSLILARAGHNTLVYQKENLRSALGRLRADVLELSQEQRRRLSNMGVRYLKDIWRLPADGLRKRFGSDFINQLNKAVGKMPEPLKYYQPPPAFSNCYDLPYEVEDLSLLLPVVDETIALLEDFLRQRDLSTSQLILSLVHEQQSNTEITLGLRQPSRSREHLMLLLETHLNKLTIPAPVVTIKVEVKKFDAFTGHSNELLSGGKSSSNHYQDNNFSQFMEQLHARLGEHRVKTIGSVAEHCPEYASLQSDYDEQQSTITSLKRVTTNPRPFWLLSTPQQLAINKGRLYHHGSIIILSGPERIETRWWSGTDIRRDYYVAMEKNGSRLWIYREKTGERNWYLHGVFA
jgi:protein ImuB